MFGVSIYAYLSVRLSRIVKNTPFMLFRRVIMGDCPCPGGLRESFFVGADTGVCPENSRQSTLSRNND